MRNNSQKTKHITTCKILYWLIQAHTPWTNSHSLTIPHLAEQEIPMLPLKLSHNCETDTSQLLAPQLNSSASVISHRSLRSQCEHLVSVCLRVITTLNHSLFTLLNTINSIFSLELCQPLPLNSILITPTSLSSTPRHVTQLSCVLLFCGFLLYVGKQSVPSQSNSGTKC